MYKIIKKQITANYVRTDDKVKYIVLHDTGNASPSADALAHFNYFCDKSAQASYHYVCDENRIIECVGKGFAAYHSGVGKSGIRQDGKLSLITNYNSIGVAYCICKGKDTLKAVKNSAIAAAYACKLYGLTERDIVRHYDVTGKNCPATMRDNQTGLSGQDEKWADFEAFKQLVKENLEAMNEAEGLCEYLYSMGHITNKEYWLDALSGTGELDIKWLRTLLMRVRD